MLDPEFWSLLDQRLAVYAQYVRENGKKVKKSPKNQFKTDRQLYEDKLDHFLQLMNVYDRLKSL